MRGSRPQALAGDAIDAGETGLFALQAPASGLPPMTVRHQGLVLDREVAFTAFTVTWDGKEFKVERRQGTIAAGKTGEGSTDPEPAAP